MTVEIRRSSGNVFRDLGFSTEEAANLKIRSDLMIQLSKVIETRGVTQAQAAKLFAVTQPRISDLVRGKTDRFSVDMLIAMLGRAGVRVQIVLGRSSKPTPDSFKQAFELKRGQQLESRRRRSGVGNDGQTVWHR